MSPRKVARILSILATEQKIGLQTWNLRDPFEVLVGTVLSQRTKDENTGRAVERLFSKYKTAEEIASAPVREIERLIRVSGFYRVKAKRIKEISRIILEKYGGKVPKDINELVKIPGVGHKTAACVLVYGFGVPEIPVDVHVAKISRRLGWTEEKNPNKIREDLMKKIPKKYWLPINSLFVRHGQRICLSGNPKCRICPINKHCKHYKDFLSLTNR